MGKNTEVTEVMVDLKKVAAENNAIFIDAKFKTLGKIPRVLIKMPKGELVRKHLIMTWDPEKPEGAKKLIVVQIPEHIKSHLYVDKSFISRDFYLNAPANAWVVVDVEVVEKHDFYRQKTNLGLNFFLSENQKEPLYEMKIGTYKEEPIEFKIPKTEKYITFKER